MDVLDEFVVVALGLIVGLLFMAVITLRSILNELRTAREARTARDERPRR